MSSKTAARDVTGYDADFYAWTQDQAAKLRGRRHNEIDWENLAEEIDSVGRSDRRGIRSNLQVVLVHLLKWQYQPEKRKGGWQASIVEHRNRIALTLEDSPSLADFPGEALAGCYASARREALLATRLDPSVLPGTCPYTIDEVLDPSFPPDLYQDLPE